MDHYEVLGLSKTASEKEIKDAYRRLVKKFHPDKNKSDEARQIIVAINEAYDVLSDPRKRNEYDNHEPYSQQEYVYEEDPREVYRQEYIKRKVKEDREEREKRERKMAKIHTLLWKLSFVTAALGLLATIDYYLPPSVYHETAIIGWQQREGGRKHSQGHLVSYMRTKNFTFDVPHEIHLNYDYFEVEEKKEVLEIKATPILHVPTEVSVYNWTFRPISTIYGGWNLLPKFLLFTSIFAIYMRNRWELYHVIALVPIILGLVTLLFYFVR